MSADSRTTKRPAYIGRRWMRRGWWRGERRQARLDLKAGDQPEPSLPRHEEKWDRE